MSSFAMSSGPFAFLLGKFLTVFSISAEVMGGRGSRLGLISSSKEEVGMSDRSAAVLATEVPSNRSVACSSLCVARVSSARYSGKISEEEGGLV